MTRWLTGLRRYSAVALALSAVAAWGAGKQEGAEPLPTSAQKVRPLLVGGQIPPVSLADAAGETVDLGDRMAARPTILVFYRGGW